MMLAVVGWLTLAGFMVIRQLLLSRRTIFVFDWYSLLLFSLALAYVFPVFAILLGITFPAGSYVHDFPGAAEAAAGAVLLLIFALTSWLGYSFARGPRLPAESPVSRRNSVLIGLILILGAAIAAWIIGFGGFVQAITSVMAIRFGTIANESSVPWFTGLTKASWFATVVAIDGLMQARRYPERPGGTLLPWILLLVSVLGLLLTGSRGAIGNVLLAIVIYGSTKRQPARIPDAAPAPRRAGKLPVVPIVVFAIAIVTLFKPIMTLIAVASTDYTISEAVVDFRQNVRTGSTSERGNLAVIGKVASDFSHFPILSTLALEDDRAHPEARDFGRDIYFGLAKLIPASIFEPSGVPLSYRSTYLILGTWESQIPPGIIAWLLFSGGPLGLLVGGFVAGIILALGERLAVHWLARSWWQQAGYIGFGITVAAGIVGGAPGDTVREVGSMIMILGVAILVGRVVGALPQKVADRSARRSGRTPVVAGR